MSTEVKKVTFTVTPEIAMQMDEAKKILYDCTQSQMIRTLIIAGLDSLASDEK